MVSFKRWYKRLITRAYIRYVNMIYIPYDSEFCLSVEKLSTIRPVLKLWIHSKSGRGFGTSETFHSWGTDELPMKSIKKLLEKNDSNKN